MTIKDLAARLGLSPIAVSMALRGHSEISEATRNRVIQCAAELGYQPNLVARQLVSGRTRVIGMVVPTLAYSFFARIAEGTAQSLRRQGYQLLLSSSQGELAREHEQVHSFFAHRVDALILASNGPIASKAEFEYIAAQRVPFVLVGRGVPAFPANFVGSDGIGIGHLATEHLIGQGCRRIAYVGGPPVAGSRQREAGYRAALEQHGLPVKSQLIVATGDSVEGGREAAAHLLRLRRSRPDGIVCYNDMVAAGAMKYLLNAGIRIPEQILLTGVGNLMFTELFRVPLTTIEQSPLDMGIHAAQLALKLIEAPEIEPTRILIPARLVERASSQGRQATSQAQAG